MAKNSRYIIGNKYGRLTIIGDAFNHKDRSIQVECLCICGNTKVVRLRFMERGISLSCGCLQRDTRKRRRSDETKKRMSVSFKGRTPTEQARRNMSEAQRGDRSHMWKGGISTQHQLIRSSLEYREWRDTVFRRDGWACVICKTKGDINADHIKPFSLFPELRFEPTNGRTLCVPCHKETDTYGRKIYNFVRVGEILKEKFGYEKKTSHEQN